MNALKQFTIRHYLNRPQVTSALVVGLSFVAASGLLGIPLAKGEAPLPVRITLLGDSVVAAPSETNIPRRGWGQFLEDYLSDAKVFNNAHGGESTKTYLASKLWPLALSTPADIWLIELGGNDSHPATESRHTEPAEFKNNLLKMIAACHTLGATPILVTPPHRRHLTKDGKLTTEFEPYVLQMRAIGASLNIPVIDLYAWTENYYFSISPDQLVLMFEPGGISHYTEKGARILASHVATELAKDDPRVHLSQKTAPTL